MSDSPPPNPTKSSSSSRSKRSRRKLIIPEADRPRPIAETAIILVLIALVIGPLVLGSYYEPYRWPLLIVSALATVVAWFDKGTWRKPPWLLWVLITGLIAHAGWMTYNAWGNYLTDPFDWDKQIVQRADQPHPDLPGAMALNESLDRITYIIPCLLLVWIVRSLCITRPNFLRRVLTTLFWSGTAIGILGLLQQFTEAKGIFWSEELSWKYLSLFFATFRSPGIASTYLNVCLAAGLGLALHHPGGRLRPGKAVLYAIGSVILASAVVAAGSKAGIVLAGVTLLLFLAMNLRTMSSLFFKKRDAVGPKRIERLTLTVALLAILSLGALSLAELQVKRWEKAIDTDFGSWQARVKMNEVQIHMMTDKAWSPLLGYGVGSFHPLFPVFKNQVDEKIYGEVYYSHNDYLQTLVEWGWGGTGAFILLIGGGVGLLFVEIIFRSRHHRRSQLVLLRSVFIGMFTFLLHANVDFPFQIESLAVIFAVLLGIGWASPHLRNQKPRKKKSKSRREPKPEGATQNG
ncbi:O-antigen ligase family protein [Sulfuriroseicoccus oceanibius]|uniref:O-antigen ligase family protein n=1 Tax=Sulfuriroseicoccus oceanibius TaxID=2707525 RepID=A0A7T7F0C5_9BACT|nr:O-antigen ligase family protein [Sulfuriroseicoccus oceanibius]QQL44338.1 O-antigen ligase family protein [Sulfuriroseicoccus oceanibius]